MHLHCMHACMAFLLMAVCLHSYAAELYGIVYECQTRYLCTGPQGATCPRPGSIAQPRARAWCLERAALGCAWCMWHACHITTLCC